MKRKYEARITNNEPRMGVGSALILAVVLTSLLAIVGVMFLMVARVDNIATSAISENRELNYAVETVVAKISQELVLDVPGLPGQEYYDYPDADNAWLASLEPYEKTAGNYYWRHISDIDGTLGNKANDLKTEIIDDYQNPSELEDSNTYSADADGDGVADSKWIELDDITSNKGKPIYAAIRIIDNGGMLNVNTAYKFDPNVGPANANLIDGSSQMQINLAALSQRGSNGSLDNAANHLQDERCGSEPNDLSLYEENVVWRYNEPDGRYTPFDISDELELRNRFLVNEEDIDTRAETLWRSCFQGRYPEVPIGSGGLYTINDWFDSVCYDASDPNAYSYRHIGTTYNMDRIIDPDGDKKVNINRDNIGLIYGALRKAFSAEPNFVGDVNDVAAQITVNLIDFHDEDVNDNVTTITVDGKTYYGFERPCVYISELAYRFRKLVLPTAPIPFTRRKSYAIELYKPYFEDDYPEPNQWQLSIEGYSDSPIPVDWSGTKHFHVIKFEDPCAPLVVNFDPNDYDPNFIPPVVDTHTISYNTTVFESDITISLERLTDAGWISVDSIVVPDWLVPSPSVEETRSFKRDITQHKCIRRLWDLSGSMMDSQSLGQGSPYYGSGDPNVIQAHPYLDPDVYENKGFKNIGEIGVLFRKPAYYEVGQDPYLLGVIGYSSSANTEDEVRLDLTDSNFQQLFKYLTVFDPTVDGIDNNGDGYGTGANEDPNELKIPGRININTAPWYVIAQLPWMKPDIAQAVVSYRDTTPGVDGFESIGELMNVDEMGYYANDADEIGDLTGFPDLTTPDGPSGVAEDDFEERDVIFARISNLVTVRSDVFAAYILVRIGTDGPQKRVIAILDRSNVYSGDGKVRIVAIHPVPDPR